MEAANKSSLERPGTLASFGTTVFAEMSALALAAGAINLGQGFPDEDGPLAVLEAAVAAIRSGANQYPPGRGVPELLEAIAAHERHWWGYSVDPASEVLVTAGATEGIAAVVLGLCQTGDEVVTFEPYYDSYAATIELAGAKRRVVRLRSPDWSFDPADLEAAITPATRLVLLNTPHNPTGKVFSAEELATVARLCVERDLIAVTDEVYEHLVFEGEHRLLASFPGMRQRTIKISSAGKTFSATGWKIGWVLGPSHLVEAAKAVKQFLTFAGGTPFQHAVSTGLGLPDDYFSGACAALRTRRDRFCDGLAQLGWTVNRPAATYFATVDIRQFGAEDGWAFCRSLVPDVGVAAVPTEVFFDDKAAGKPLIRFAFCKRLDVIDDALERLADVPLA
ncbi:MAG TPA: aminotransferase class I/II-fold pyridoxal phosphate-dependent enzyme [Acidimicrobiales bacterium]|jgi:N-succinyldiaminopimelate aminotransferase|nr:aminotransferase class I/II-fold pyridoxal phosphate-dependent enzyme [Acidimicrobiales bacterium]